MLIIHLPLEKIDLFNCSRCRSVTPVPPNVIYNSKIILSIVISFVQICNRHLNICTPPKSRENQLFCGGTGVTVTPVPPSAYIGPNDSELVHTIVISFVQIRGGIICIDQLIVKFWNYMPLITRRYTV
jgi:hypothetical protein